MYLMIDNYDSFVYNLAAYFKEINCNIIIRRNDEIKLKEISEMIEKRTVKGLVISPGPKNPEDCGLSKEIVFSFYDKIPILGVCLGHQIIGSVFGAKIIKGEKPVHGKLSNICHTGKDLFQNLEKRFKVTRYHSLIVSKDNFPEILKIDAFSDDGVIMALSHKKYPCYGVQFHPEAVLSQNGHELLKNFIKISERRYEKYAY